MRTAIVGCVLVVCGCNWGTRPVNFPPAQGPAGALVTLRIDGENDDRHGELFTVDSIGVTIMDRTLLESRLTRIAWPRLYSMDVHQLGNAYCVFPREAIRMGGMPLARRELLASVSRFPGGLDGELLKRVLTFYHQDARIEVAQSPMDSIAFVVAQTAAQFADRRRAMAAGYRRVGGDFPSMGEHWINMEHFEADSIDPNHPSFLTYATINAVPQLLGVGFIATTVGTDTPTGLPGWPSLWHEHSGLLAEESAGAHAPSQSATHVWVLHIWTVLPNPGGRYSADNWALPFARAGLTPPGNVSAEAGRALSLVVGGDEFLKGVLRDSHPMSHAAATGADDAIEGARQRVAIVAQATSEGLVSAAQVSELQSIWSQLSVSLESRLGVHVASVLSPSHTDKRHAPR